MNNPLSSTAKIVYYSSLDSTMLEARRLVDTSTNNVTSGTVIRAGFQTCGRGRIENRKWLTIPDEALLFTIIFTAGDLSKRMKGKPFTLLPLLCGLAVSLAVESRIPNADIKIKWPNDVLINGRKLCGILCENSADYFYIGIGININQEEFPAHLRRPACSLKMLTGKNLNLEVILGLVLERISITLSDTSWKEEIEKRLYLKNSFVKFDVGLAKEIDVKSEQISGRLKGLDSSGSVIVETSSGSIPVITGELRL